MKIDFALFLSPEGIALAHRQPAGHWAFVGDTALDVPNFKDALADLLKKGEERGGQNFATLLVLPDDQILYTSLTVPPGDGPLRTARIEEGLDGLTPYGVADLVWDLREVDDIRVKLAVVAQETLDEARAFATDAGFNSVAFAAAPPLERFPGVPVFGKTADGDTLHLPDEGLAFGPDQWTAKPPATAPAAASAQATPEASPTAADTATAGAKDTATDTSVTTDRAAAPVVAAPREAAETAPAAPLPDTPQPAVSPTPPAAVAKTAPDAGPALTSQAAPNGRTAEPKPTTTAEPTTPTEADDTPPDAMDDAVTRPVTPLPDTDDDDAAPAVSPMAQDTPAKDARLVATKDSATLQPKGRQAAPLTAKRTTPDTTTETRVARFTPTVPSKSGQDEVLSDPSVDDDLPPVPANFLARRGPGGTAGHGTARVVSNNRQARVDTGRPGDAPATFPSPAAGRVLHPDAADFPTETGAVTGATSGATPPSRLAAQLTRVRDASRSVAKPTPAPPSNLTQTAAYDAPLRPVGQSRTPEPAANTAKTGTGRSGLFGRLLPTRRKDTAETTDKPKADTAQDRAEPVAASATGAETTESSFSEGLLARKASPVTAGPSFRTGLILTLVLLILLALIAIWAVIFLPNSTIGRLFAQDPVVASAPAPDDLPPITPPPPAFDTAAALPVTRLLDEDEAAADVGALADMDEEAALIAQLPDVQAPATLPDIDADFDLGPDPLAAEPTPPLPTLEATEEMYAAFSIWQLPPDAPQPGNLDVIDGLYTASIDPEITGLDAIALPETGINPNEEVMRQASPAAFGATFALNDQGLVEPTPEGALTPAGAFIIAGAPPVQAVPRPREVVIAPVINVDDVILRAFRPELRPDDLGELRERQLLGGLTTTELATLRPTTRPASAQEVAAAANASLVPLAAAGSATADSLLAAETAPEDGGPITGTALAVVSSSVPVLRPASIERIVAAAATAPEADAEAVPAVAASAAPVIPSNASVTRAATEDNVLNLRRINLIGVTGSPSDRYALVRLASGRFVRVGVGDRIDGGQVAAIGETTLQYIKNGRNITLEIAS